MFIYKIEAFHVAVQLHKETKTNTWQEKKKHFETLEMGFGYSKLGLAFLFCVGIFFNFAQ